MRFLMRIFERLFITCVAIGSIWFIVNQVFDRLDQRAPLFVALALTYVISAYLLMPPIIHLTTLILRKGRIPRRTYAKDGLPADPVNILLFGTREDLLAAFEAAGWQIADRLTLQSAWKMVVAFVLNRPYPAAPFSSLYLFGRRQDIGFQESIGKSPRRRHHIRFWAINSNPELNDTMAILEYWMHGSLVDMTRPLLWVGAGTTDTGFGFSKLTFQVSHRVAKDIDREREYILNCLLRAGKILDIQRLEYNDRTIGKYISDGHIVTARLQ